MMFETQKVNYIFASLLATTLHSSIDYCILYDTVYWSKLFYIIPHYTVLYNTVFYCTT